MSTARWELQTVEVPISRVNVFAPSPPLGSRGGGGFHIQLGAMLLWVQSQAHWNDLVEQVAQRFADLPPRHHVPLPRKGMKANVAGACWEDDE